MLTHVAWALTLLPGLWVVRRHAPALASAGPMAQIALGYLATLCLISPLSMAGYLWQLPVAVVGVGLCMLVVSGAALLWRDRFRGPSAAANVIEVVDFAGALCLLVLLAMQARVGGWLDGDATFHLGRIRDVLDHGLSNNDILVRPPRFHAPYHTNLLHALYASLSWLTAQSPIDVWFDTQLWATLVVGAGHYLLGYVLTGSRTGGWALCLLTLGARASVTYTLYPNALSVGFLLPTLSALALLSSMDPGPSMATWPSCSGPAASSSVRQQATLGLAAAVFVIGQVHALYAVYALGLWVPVLVFRSLRARGEARRGAVRALAVMALCIPSVIVAADRTRAEIPPSRDAPARPDDAALSEPRLARWGAIKARNTWERRSPDSEKTAALRAGGGHLEKRLDHLESGQYVLRPRHMGGAGWIGLGFAALLLLAWVDRGRRGAWSVVLASASGLALLLFVPALCTLAVRAASSAFIVARLSTWLSTLLLCGLAGVFALLVARLRRGETGAPRLAAVLLPVLCISATFLPGHGPRAIGDHLQQVLAPASERRAQQRLLHARQRFLREHLPAGRPVLADLSFARHVTMLHDVPVIAADRGMARATDVATRIRDVGIMTAARTPPDVRGALLAHYGLRWFVYRDRDVLRHGWASHFAIAHHRGADLHVLELRVPQARGLQ